VCLIVQLQNFTIFAIAKKQKALRGEVGFSCFFSKRKYKFCGIEKNIIFAYA
jgi:hypothetical protein